MSKDKQVRIKNPPNKIGLWDLYDKNIYVRIKEKINNDFFNHFRENNSKLKILDLWGYQNRIYFTPLDLIIKILDTFPVENRKKFKKIIESNLEGLRYGYGKGKSIKNPELPIKFSPELARICGHLIGDGGIRRVKGDYAVHYTNQNSLLIKQFKEDIFTIFGSVEAYEYRYHMKDKNKNLKVIRFPSIVGIILMEFFGPMIKSTKKIPKIILESDKKYKSLFLQALYDDEGCVSSNRIIIAMSNKDIIKNIKDILEREFSISPSNIRERRYIKWQNSYILEIFGVKNMITFSKEIGFSHSKKKDKLDTYIKNHKRIHFRKGELKVLICNLLKERKNLSVYDIAASLNIKPKRSLRAQLFLLEKRKIIKPKINKGRIKVYSLV